MLLSKEEESSRSIPEGEDFLRTSLGSAMAVIRSIDLLDIVELLHGIFSRSIISRREISYKELPLFIVFSFSTKICKNVLTTTILNMTAATVIYT